MGKRSGWSWLREHILDEHPEEWNQLARAMADHGDDEAAEMLGRDALERAEFNTAEARARAANCARIDQRRRGRGRGRS